MFPNWKVEMGTCASVSKFAVLEARAVSRSALAGKNQAVRHKDRLNQPCNIKSHGLDGQSTKKVPRNKLNCCIPFGRLLI